MRCLLGPFGCLLDNDNNDDPLYIYLSFKKSIYFRYALVLWIFLTAGWNKARPIGKRTGEVGGLGCWSAMPKKKARGSTKQRALGTRKRESNPLFDVIRRWKIPRPRS